MVGEQMRNIGGVLGVRAAHRLDGWRVRGFPDWAVRPGEIWRGCLEKQRSNTKNTLNSCSHFHWKHSVVKKHQNKIHWLVRQRIDLPVNSTKTTCTFLCVLQVVVLHDLGPPLAAVGIDIPVDPDDVLTMCPNTSRGATSSVLTAKTCTSSAGCYTNTH